MGSADHFKIRSKGKIHKKTGGDKAIGGINPNLCSITRPTSLLAATRTLDRG